MKYLKSCFVRVFVLNIICVLSYSQTITIKDIQTLHPIPFVNVYENDKQGETSNYKGEVDIGKYNPLSELTISCVGYKTRKITKKEIQDKKNIVFLSLSKTELENIVISVNKQKKPENKIHNET